MDKLRKLRTLLLVLLMLLVMVSTSCGGSGSGGGDDDPDNPGNNPDDPGGDPKDPIATLDINGNTYTYTLPGGTIFNMKLTPNIETTNEFPCNIDADSDYDEDTANVPDRFLIGETEVTYELWKEVYDWATSADRGVEKYTFANAGKQGGYFGSGKADTNQHPVTTINWRDTIVWCNALTEYYNANNGNATDLAVVYCSEYTSTTPIRISTNSTTISWDSGSTYSGTEDEPYINLTAKGFRLPDSIEWEFVGRYIGTTEPSHEKFIEKGGFYYTSGDCASSATDSWDNIAATGLVAVCDISNTKEVKSKEPNALQLYDMSGNMWEWCFDWHPNKNGTNRVFRGGGWNDTEVDTQIGRLDYYEPYTKNYGIGFRFCRTQ